MKAIRGWLFDLDGTLLDSAADLVAALNWLREREGLAPVQTGHMSRYVSRGAIGILNAGMPPASDLQFAEWKELFLNRYAQVGFQESQLYPGIEEVLHILSEKRIPWGIVTNKITTLTLPILKSSGLLEKAACVVCGDTLHQSKPHPAPVLHACSLLKVEACDVMFAGDDVRDIQAGKSAGTLTAAVMYGYGSHEFEAEHLADCAVIRHPSEFIEFIG